VHVEQATEIDGGEDREEAEGTKEVKKKGKEDDM